MRKVEIGLSVYPDFYDFEVIKKQLEVAASLGYTRVFTSIQLGNLGFENTGDSLSDGFIELFKLTRKLGMKVHVDLNLEVFTQIGAEVDNVKPIVDLNIDVIRLDGGFCIDEIVRLTANPYGLVIEDNTSNEGHLLETVETINERGNINNYRACHNFYPRNETGLDFDDAVYTSDMLNDFGVGNGIFITSQTSPADLNQSGEGIPSIEEHRYLPPHIAFSELRNTGVFDMILFGDSMPDYASLKAVSDAASVDYVELEAWLDKDLDPKQHKVLTETVLYSRQDQPRLLLRATQTRKKAEVPVKNTIARPYLSITLDNIRSNRYECEVQIALEDLNPSAVANVVGMVKPTCKRLLNQVKYRQYPFKIKE
jgi:hypothetical protein